MKNAFFSPTQEEGLPHAEIVAEALTRCDVVR